MITLATKRRTRRTAALVRTSVATPRTFFSFTLPLHGRHWCRLRWNAAALETTPCILLLSSKAGCSIDCNVSGDFLGLPGPENCVREGEFCRLNLLQLLGDLTIQNVSHEAITNSVFLLVTEEFSYGVRFPNKFFQGISWKMDALLEYGPLMKHLQCWRKVSVQLRHDLVMLVLVSNGVEYQLIEDSFGLWG